MSDQSFDQKPNQKNQLSHETSPYLLQHKDNPVHWWPWGEAALNTAKDENKPILISIGYAACHWCHVMARESFEDQETATMMNEKFINIKVDREEHPEIDTIYMSALKHLDGQTGWPLTMFLTSEAKPFWGGTYFPSIPETGRPSFKQAMTFADKIFHEDKEAMLHNANSLTQLIAPEKPKMQGPEITDQILTNISQRISEMIDNRNSGLRGAPKFPQYPLFNFLWRVGLRLDQEATRKSVENLLNVVFQGGIYDHLGGGLARFTTDEKWLIPHFEKMLYDNALMMELAVNVYKETKNPLLKTRVAEIVAWSKQEMLTKEGAFAASLDSESEGEEGKFYIWQADEIKSTLGDDYEFFAKHYHVTKEGNFEGKTILNRLQSPDLLSKEQEEKLTSLKSKLLTRRKTRTPPARDDKILSDWNGMMITALCLASETFAEKNWLDMAETAYQFIASNMINKDGLHHSYRLGKLASPALAADYAQMIRASLTLYNTTSKATYLENAKQWTKTLNENFWCPDYGAYFTTSKSRRDVIIRGKSGADETTPNANAVMISNLMMLYILTGDKDMHKKAKKTTRAFGSTIAKNIFSHVGILAAAIDVINPLHLVIIAPAEDQQNAEDMKTIAKTVAIPNLLIQSITPDQDLPAISPAYGKQAIEGKSTAYICAGTQCHPPITNSLALISALKKAVKE